MPDNQVYELAKKVSEKAFRSISIEYLSPFAQWNYVIRQE
jgi:hypothetical protein